MTCMRSVLRAARHGTAFAALLASITAADPIGARAEVRVQQGRTSLRIEVSQSQVAEALLALGQVADVRHSTAVPLDRVIDGTYSGSLEQILARLLDGYSYWIKKRGSSVEVIVVGTRGQSPVVGLRADPNPGQRTVAANAYPPNAIPARSLAAQWRDVRRLRRIHRPRRADTARPSVFFCALSCGGMLDLVVSRSPLLAYGM